MPRTCTVCRHDHRQEINRALITGQPLRHIAAQFRLSASALQRHKREEVVSADLPLDISLTVVCGLQERIMETLGQAPDGGDVRSAAALFRLAERSGAFAHAIKIDAMRLLGGFLQPGALATARVRQERR